MVLVVKVRHDPLQRLLPQLPMGNADREFRQQLAQFACRLVNGFDLVVQIENLPSAKGLPQDGLFDQRNAVLTDEGLDGEAPRRGRSDNR